MGRGDEMGSMEAQAALDAALAAFGVPAETEPSRRRRSLPVLGTVLGLLVTLVAAAFGASLSPDVAPDPSPAPVNANHCFDTVGPTNHHACAQSQLVTPTNGQSGLTSTPTLTAKYVGGFYVSGSLQGQICSDAACTSQVQSLAYTGMTLADGQDYSWVASSLANGTYWWRVIGSDLHGNGGDYTPTWSFTVGGGAGAAPNAPSSLAQYRSDGTTVIAGAAYTNQSTVVLKFNVSDPDASQTLTPWVEVRTTNSFTGTCGTAGAGMYSGTNVSAPTGGTNYLATVTVAGLSDSTTYYWRACSKDQGGNVSTWTARAGAPDYRLDANAPTNPAQSQIYDLTTSTTVDRDATTSTTSLSMNWEAGSDGTGSGVLNYDACFSSVNTGCTPITGTAMVSANTTRQATATATGMSNGVTYYTCVRTRDNQSQVSGWQCSDGFTVNTSGTPPSVTLIAPAAGAWVTDDTPTVQARYDDPDGTSGMVRVEFCGTNASSPWSTNCASGYRMVQTAADGVISGQTASLAPNTAIAQAGSFWRAQSVDAQGLQSAWSAGRAINVDSVAPAPIPTITLVRRGRGRIDVDYTPATDALSPPVTYDVEAFNNGTGLWEVLCNDSTSLTCTKTGLGGTELFVVRVKACDSRGNCTAWATAGAVANSGYLLRNLTATNLNNTQSRKAQLGAGGAQDATTTGIQLPGGGAAARIGSFPFRYNTTVAAAVALDTTAPITPQNTTSGWGWVIDDVENKALTAGSIELEAVTTPVTGASGSGTGRIRCRAWKVLTNGSTAMTATMTYIGEAYGDVADVMTASGSGTTSSTCTIASPTQLSFANNEVLYVEPILEATVAGTTGDTYRLVFNDASSSINIPQPGTPPNTAVLISPANAAITSTTPTLTAQYLHPTPVVGRLEIQYSQDPTFATGVTTESTTQVSSGANGSITTNSLAPGSVWYWRARGVDTSDLASVSWSASRTFTVSTAPLEPTPTAPANAATLTPGAKTFTASAFSDPNGAGDSHTASEWVIIPAGGSWLNPAYTSGVTTTSLTSWTSPALPDGEYEWRVRYRDNFGMWSAWSGTTPANARTLTITSGTLSLSSSASTIALGLQATGVDDFGSATLTVVATGPTGYTLHASDESDTMAAFCTCGTDVPDWTGTSATPTVWTSGSAGWFGITVRNATVSRLAKWGTGTGTAETDVVNNRYAGLKAGSSVVLHTRASATAGDSVVATWRLNPDASLLAGAYTNQTAMTVVANP